MSNAVEANFIVTREYRRFAEFCDARRRYRYIGLCYGPPGVGKTLSARHYANWDRVEGFDLYDNAMMERLAAVLPCETIFYTPGVTNSPGQIERDIHSAATTSDPFVSNRFAWKKRGYCTRSNSEKTRYVVRRGNAIGFMIHPQSQQKQVLAVQRWCELTMRSARRYRTLCPWSWSTKPTG